VSPFFIELKYCTAGGIAGSLPETACGLVRRPDPPPFFEKRKNHTPISSFRKPQGIFVGIMKTAT
jgi:hypothetical protein